MKILKGSYSCVFAVAVLVLLSNAFVRAQSADSRFDEYMNAMVNLGRFNGYVLIARDGKAVFSKGYGMANFEYDVPNTAQTRFRIASITKSFTAMAVMMLREQGKLSLQDSVCKYVSDCPETWKPVTIRHLLNHVQLIFFGRTLFNCRRLAFVESSTPHG